MLSPLSVQVFEKTVLKHSDEFDGPVELGRQRSDEAEPFSRSRENGRWRLVVARRNEGGLSRNHVLLEPQQGEAVAVTNLSAGQPVGLEDGRELGPGERREVQLPLVMRIAGKSFRVQAAGHTRPVPAPPSPPPPPPPPRAASSGGSPGGAVAARPASRASFPTTTEVPGLRPPPLAGHTSSEISSGTLIQWLHIAVNVLRAAASSEDFFDRAARAIVDLVELDAGRVLLYRQGKWHVQSLQMARRLRAPSVRPPSETILSEVLEEKRTVWRKPFGSDPDGAQSLMDVEAVVAAPMLDRDGEVVGVIYGERCASADNVVPNEITEIEAMLVELLALGVTVGQARLEQEQAAIAERVRFEQFFTPELADQLGRHPDWLEGREAEVSVLFCDIRGFSLISERLGAQRTVEWCRDVLDELSDCVLRRAGVLVDYTGDGLMAMWGAPEPQPDHARRACSAALDMLGRLPELNRRWEPVIGGAIGLGVGVNTGTAQVGNTGSRHKFKYGPRGNAVNLASRVEGATKYLKCPLLITAGTQAQLDDSFCTRRLAQLRVVNIEAPVVIYELGEPGRPDWPGAKREYELALEQFERQDFGQAVRTLGNWRGHCPNDDAALVLLHRTVTCMVHGTPGTHPVFVLGEK